MCGFPGGFLKELMLGVLTISEVCVPESLKCSGKIPNIFHNEIKMKYINDSSKSNNRTLVL